MHSGYATAPPERQNAPDASSGTYGRSSAVGVRRLGGGVALCLALLLLGYLVGTRSVTSVDTGVLRGVAHLRNGPFTLAAKALSLVATPELWAGLGIVIPLGLFLARRRGDALRVCCVLIGSAGVTFVAKAIVGEHRPPRSLWIQPPSSSSFPSGHTAAATAIVVCALVLAPLGARRAVALAGGAFILLVAASRAYLGVHYVPDTAGGVLSTACATVFLTGLANLPPGRKWLLQLDDASR